MPIDFAPLGKVPEQAHAEILNQITSCTDSVRDELSVWFNTMSARFDLLNTEIVALKKMVQDINGPPTTEKLDPRDINFPIGVAAVREWCGRQNPVLAPWSRIYRLAAGVLTESYGGYALDNEGAAFPDTGVTPWAPASMPLATRQAARKELQKSTALLHDRHPKLGATKNGASVGWLQQIPLALTIILYNKTWGYGTSAATSVADCLDVRTSTLMFCDRLQVTNKTSYTAADGTVITGLDPIMADLLTLQNPAATEAKNTKQYGPDMVIRVKHMVDNWDARYFTDMPDAPVLQQ